MYRTGPEVVALSLMDRGSVLRLTQLGPIHPQPMALGAAGEQWFYERWAAVADVPDLPALVEFELVYEGEGSPPRCVAMRLTPRDATTDLGGVKLPNGSQLVRLLRWVVGQSAMPAPPGPLGGMSLRRWPPRQPRAIVDELRPRKPRITDEKLSRVAAHYREAVAAGVPPRPLIAEREVVSESTAATWIGKARQRGLLGPALGTRAGEAPRGTARETATNAEVHRSTSEKKRKP